jgi:hypothetical protein
MVACGVTKSQQRVTGDFSLLVVPEQLGFRDIDGSKPHKRVVDDGIGMLRTTGSPLIDP